MIRLLPIFTTLFCIFTTSTVWAYPAIIYMGKSNDGAYNNSLRQGIIEFEKKTGKKCIQIDGAGEAGYIKDVLRCINKKYSPIILPYSNQFPGLMEVIRKNKTTDFVFLDFGDVDLPNVWAFSFADHEGAFLAGALAALMTKTKTIGFIYTSNQYPVLLRFRSGFIQGAKNINPNIKVLESQLGNYDEVWQDTKSCEKIAARLISQGADVLFAAAGFAGKGALTQAAKNKIYAIGVDSNQNDLYPGTMIGSMIKRNDKALFIALKLALSGIHRDGVKRLGLAQNAMLIDFDGVQAGLVPNSVKKRLESLKAKITQGKLRLKKTNK